MITNDFNMFNIVNKTNILQHKIKDMKNVQYVKNNKNLYTNNT